MGQRSQMVPKSIPDLPLDVLCCMTRKLFSLDEPAQAQTPWILNASLACKDLAKAWRHIRTGPCDRELLQWLALVHPKSAAVVLLKLGLPAPCEAMNILAEAVGRSEDVMSRYACIGAHVQYCDTLQCFVV